MGKFDEWGEILRKGDFQHNSIGSAPKHLAKYFCINGMGELLEIFLPKRYIRILMCSTLGQYHVLEYAVANPAAPKNTFYENTAVLDKNQLACDVTKMLEQM